MNPVCRSEENCCIGAAFVASVGSVLGVCLAITFAALQDPIGVLGATAIIIINILLYYGIRENRPVYVLVWLVAVAVLLMVLITATIVLLCTMIYIDSNWEEVKTLMTDLYGTKSKETAENLAYSVKNFGWIVETVIFIFTVTYGYFWIAICRHLGNSVEHSNLRNNNSEEENDEAAEFQAAAVGEAV